MAGINEIRIGMILNFKNDLYIVSSADHVKPGKGSAFARCKLKNLKTGNVIEQTWKSSESVDPVRVERKKFQYLYNDGTFLALMDIDSYEQYNYPIDEAKDLLPYMKDNDEIEGLMYEDNVIGIELPFFVYLKVLETEPGVKGDTATNATKPAKTETGLVVMVPLFVENDDTLKIDTRTGDYIERSKK